VGCAEYDPKVNVIRLWVYKGGNDDHEVNLEMCQTAEQFAHWVIRISGNTWCKGAVLTDFMHCLKNAIRERHNKDLYSYFKV
jgi:hypothetical protein